MDVLIFLEKYGFWAAAVAALIVGWIVPGYIYRREVQRAEQYRELFLRAHGTTAKAIDIVATRDQS